MLIILFDINYWHNNHHNRIDLFIKLAHSEINLYEKPIKSSLIIFYNYTYQNIQKLHH